MRLTFRTECLTLAAAPAMRRSCGCFLVFLPDPCLVIPVGFWDVLGCSGIWGVLLWPAVLKPCAGHRPACQLPWLPQATPAHHDGPSILTSDRFRLGVELFLGLAHAAANSLPGK